MTTRNNPRFPSEPGLTEADSHPTDAEKGETNRETQKEEGE